MTDCTKDDYTKDYTQASLPLKAHDNRSVFLENARNIGRAYRNQALELISICQLLSRIAPPKLVHEHSELRRTLRVCDLALRSAANSGTRVTDETNARFEEATRILSNHSVRRHLLDFPLTVYSRMELAKRKDDAQRDRSYVDDWGPTMATNFVLLQSPLLTPHDPDVVALSSLVRIWSLQLSASMGLVPQIASIVPTVFTVLTTPNVSTLTGALELFTLSRSPDLHRSIVTELVGSEDTDLAPRTEVPVLANMPNILKHSIVRLVARLFPKSWGSH
ncbi:hypothetical protein V8E53_008749 [Lactarius tabidus]